MVEVSATKFARVQKKRLQNADKLPRPLPKGEGYRNYLRVFTKSNFRGIAQKREWFFHATKGWRHRAV